MARGYVNPRYRLQSSFFCGVRSFGGCRGGATLGIAGGSLVRLLQPTTVAFAEALTSVLAIVALLGVRYRGWVWLDPVMGRVGALLIARRSHALINSSAAVLLDTRDDRLAAVPGLAHLPFELRSLRGRGPGASAVQFQHRIHQSHHGHRQQHQARQAGHLALVLE